ncbi:hypothetical protein HZH68_016488 [Vespula germanica]|uniref:Uncharacterized protein n=1 Tax=Vespula germanica TaxID=30212 RepID=A0A834J1U6_VESGE|nr:hypothetical protein HZH68_016488 [Vespula germanica]
MLEDHGRLEISIDKFSGASFHVVVANDDDDDDDDDDEDADAEEEEEEEEEEKKEEDGEKNDDGNNDDEIVYAVYNSSICLRSLYDVLRIILHFPGAGYSSSKHQQRLGISQFYY